MFQQVSKDFQAKLPADLVGALLTAFEEIKQNFFIEKFEPSELNGGKFCEACVRIIQYETNAGVYTPLGTPITNMNQTLKDFEKIPAGPSNESFRIHIPRVLFAIYNIRNKRGVGHLGGDVNPNISDSSLILNCVNWVMAELFRIYYQCSLGEAQVIVNSLIQRQVPLIYDIGDIKRVLLPGLYQKDQVLLLLTVKFPLTVSDNELISWIEPGNQSSFRGILRKLHSSRFIEYDKMRFCVALPPCLKYVESQYNSWVTKLNKEE